MNGDHAKMQNGDALRNKITVVLGAQWGDEGNGKVVDMLAKDADLVCRCQVWKTRKLNQKFITDILFNPIRNDDYNMIGIEKSRDGVRFSPATVNFRCLFPH